MANPRYRSSRARIRARYRKPRQTRTSKWFYAAISVVVIAGVVGVVALRPTDAGVRPLPADPATGQPVDHWHAALGAYICGEWLVAAREFHTIAGNDNVQTGIHTHGDGYIHIHPYYRSESGNRATLGRFLTSGGWEASETEMSLWSGPSTAPFHTDWADGDRCPDGTEFAGERGVVKWAVDCRERSGNPSDHKLADQEVIALAFLPRGEEIPVPPSAAEEPEADAEGDDPEAAATPGCAPVQPGNPGQSPLTTGTVSPDPSGAPATSAP